MSAALKVNRTNIKQLDSAARLKQEVADAIASGVKIDELVQAISLLRRVKAGDVASMLARPDFKDKNALWIKGVKWVK